MGIVSILRGTRTFCTAYSSNARDDSAAAWDRVTVQLVRRIAENQKTPRFEYEFNDGLVAPVPAPGNVVRGVPLDVVLGSDGRLEADKSRLRERHRRYPRNINRAIAMRMDAAKRPVITVATHRIDLHARLDVGLVRRQLY